MTIGDSFTSALRAIMANKLRSSLTMLGVVIGVGSVIAMIGIGEGTKLKSLESIEKMGSNMITVVPDWRRGGMRGAGGGNQLKQEDVNNIRMNVPTVDLISGGVGGQRFNRPVKFGNRNATTQIWGVEPQMAIIRNATKMFQGQWFTPEDDNLNRQVAVLGYQVYDNLFAGENAMGATIQIMGKNYEVVGVIDYKGGSGFMNPDDLLYIPLQTAQNRLMGTKDLHFITIQAINSDLLPITQAKIEETLAATRRNAMGENQFRIFNQGEMIEQVQTQSRLLSFLLAGIASVSLLVGGIGIMNIMLVSVTERTREIGLRKAIGAKRESILTQFLLESVVMCVLGGAIGIVLGYIAIRYVAEALKVPPVINAQAVVMAFGFSVLVGLFFGLYPAMRAARLQPIEALRYE